jgi:hypothetical protein
VPDSYSPLYTGTLATATLISHTTHGKNERPFDLGRAQQQNWLTNTTIYKAAEKCTLGYWELRVKEESLQRLRRFGRAWDSDTGSG